MIDADVHGNPPNPGCQGFVRVEPTDVPDDLPQHFLRQIQGILLIPGAPPADGVDVAPVLPEQQFEAFSAILLS